MVEDAADGRWVEGSVWPPSSATDSRHVRISVGYHSKYCADPAGIGSADELWEFFEGWPSLALPLASIHAASTLRARRRILDGIKKWHAYALQHKDYEKEDLEYE